MATYAELHADYARTGDITTFLEGVRTLFGIYSIECGAIITQSGISYGTYNVGPPIYQAAGAPPPGSSCSWVIYPPDPPALVPVAPPPTNIQDTRRLTDAKAWIEKSGDVNQAPYVYSVDQACALAARISKTYRGLSNSRSITFPWRYPIGVGVYVAIEQPGQPTFNGYCYALEWNATGREVTKTALLMEALDA